MLIPSTSSRSLTSPRPFESLRASFHEWWGFWTWSDETFWSSFAFWQWQGHQPKPKRIKLTVKMQTSKITITSVSHLMIWVRLAPFPSTRNLCCWNTEHQINFSGNWAMRMLNDSLNINVKKVNTDEEYSLCRLSKQHSRGIYKKNFLKKLLSWFDTK